MGNLGSQYTASPFLTFFGFFSLPLIFLIFWLLYFSGFFYSPFPFFWLRYLRALGAKKGVNNRSQKTVLFTPFFLLLPLSFFLSTFLSFFGSEPGSQNIHNLQPL